MGINYVRNLIKIKRITIGLILIMIICPYAISKAQSVSITISTDNNSIIIGEEVLVSIQLTSKSILGDFEAYISYDPDVLEFINDASFIAGGEGLLKVSDINVINQDDTRKYVIKFIAKDIGNSEIGIKDRAVIYDYESGEEMSLSSNRISVQVTAQKEASKNNNLQSLKISPGTLIPEFNKDITKYTVQVVSEVNQLVISSITEDELATVTTTGNEKLKSGVNEVSVTVKAQSGDQKVYKLNVIKDSLAVEDKVDEKEETQNFNETNEYNVIEDNSTIINHMVIMKDKNAIYIQNGFRYEILELIDETKIPENYIKTTKTLNGVNINAYTLINDKENDFFLVYAKNENGDEGFYQFDRVENTIQRYTKSQSEYIKSKNETDNIKDFNDRSIIITLILTIIVLLILVILLFFIFNHSRVNSKKSRIYKVDNNNNDTL
jgi:hypothetical protein